MALSSSSIGDLGLTRAARYSSGDTGETISPMKLRWLLAAAGECRAEEAAPSLSLISSFHAVGLLSWSLKAGLRGPISPEVVFSASLGGVAPVRRWTTARKVEGSAWTKVVLGMELGSKAFVKEWNVGGNGGIGLGLLLEEEDAMGEARRVIRDREAG